MKAKDILKSIVRNWLWKFAIKWNSNSGNIELRINKYSGTFNESEQRPSPRIYSIRTKRMYADGAKVFLIEANEECLDERADQHGRTAESIIDFMYTVHQTLNVLPNLYCDTVVCSPEN